MTDSFFINQLVRFFNYGYTGKVDKLAACYDLSLALLMNAENISNKFRSLSPDVASNETLKIKIPAYDGKNRFVNQIGKYLQSNLKDEIAHAIIHGSVATNEENNYSDFDSLIVLKDDIFSNKKQLIHTAKHLNRSYKMMLSYDRYQHHGWFILCEKHLHNWPCSYFPPDIFKHSRSFNEFNPQLQIKYNEFKQYSKESLVIHCNKIIHKLNKSGLPGNVFQIKCLFSEFMLIPSIYVQVKTGKGVFKKQSFDIAKSDFHSHDWQVMDDISEIRNQWPAFRGLENKNDYFTPITRYRQIHDGLKLPDNITKKLNAGLIKQMIHLAGLFIQKSDGFEVH